MFFSWRREQEPLDSRLLALALRFGFYIAALWLAAEWVHGLEIEGWQSLVALAAILTAVNAVIAPVVRFFSWPLTCLTLGLFTLLINTAMLALAAWIAGQLDFDGEVDGFWAAFLGALVVSAVSVVLDTFFGGPLRRALR